MHKLCEPNPSWRYSANLAIKHPWITRNPNDDIPLTFNEILNKNNSKKSAQTLIMISIFLNYIQKNNKFQINNNNNNNITNFEVFIKKKKIRNKLFFINYDYIKKCNIISKKQKERYQKIKERYLEVLSTDEEDSFEKKQNYNHILSKKLNKSSEKYCSPPKKYYEDDQDYEYSNRFQQYNNKNSLNKKKIINLNNNNNFLLRNNYQQTNSKNKNKSTNIHILSVPNNKEKNNNISDSYNKKISSNKNINSNRFLLNINPNKNTINQAKAKSKSISKFYINKNEQNDNNQNEIINEADYKEITPEKKKRTSVYKSSKINKLQIKPNLPYVSTLGTNTKNTSSKLTNNYIGIYNIKPIVLPFIGIKQEDKKNKMI